MSKFTRSWMNEIDYTDKLSDSDKEFIEKFNYDYIGYVKKEDETYSLEGRRELYNNASAARRDILNFNDSFLASTSEEYIQPKSNLNPESELLCLEAYTAIIEVSISNPVWGKRKVAKELERRGFSLSPESIDLIWKDEDLSNRDKRKQAQLVEA